MKFLNNAIFQFLYNENIKRVGNIVYLPIYLMMFIKNREIENLIWKIDLSSLPQ